MNSQQLKLNQCYLLFKSWWKSTELTNFEKYILNNEIITFNQQLIRLNEKIIRIGVYGKTGVGKSSISNNILQENFFHTGILNGLIKNPCSKELHLKNNFIKSIELIDYPGFDICNNNKEKEIQNLNALDLILFVTSGDVNRQELDKLLLLIRQGKNIILIINKADIWDKEEIEIIKNNIREKLPINCNIPIITYSIKDKDLCYKHKIFNYLNITLNRIGYNILIYNTYQIANKLACNIKEERLIKRKQKAQSLIGKFATVKASSVALNPIIFIDIAGSATLDTILINELSKLYGLKVKSKSAISLLKTISLNNLFLGITQIGIHSSFNLIKKISLIMAPFTGGLSLIPYGPVAIVQAAIALYTTKTIGKLVAKEILERSMINNLDPFKNIQQIIFKDPDILCSKKYFKNSQNSNRDSSILIP